MENIKTIMEWHKETFPRAELISQARRVCAEFAEYKEADNYLNQIEELADVFIAWCGLLRFDVNAKMLPLYEEIARNFVMSDFVKAVQRKMNVNRQRSAEDYWVWVDNKQQYIAAHKFSNN
ncbi:MAG: hypothetical protein R3Y43_01590 [Alphaproteobacteria bacterium]